VSGSTDTNGAVGNLTMRIHLLLWTWVSYALLKKFSCYN
jgi:hypothetical protein